MKRALRLVIILLLLNQFAIAQNDSVPKRKEYTTTRALKTPKIDGLLDDETWKTAPLISDFKQNFPIYDVEPTQSTHVQIVYDNTI